MTDYLDDTSSGIMAVDLSSYSVPLAKKADTATKADSASEADTAAYAVSADSAANADYADYAGSANALTNSVKIYGQDFKGTSNVDGALNINNATAVNPGGNLYNCSTPFILNSTQTTYKDSSGNTRTTGITYVGAKLTTTRENKINNTTTVTGYGVYTDGDILYMWHQNNNNLYTNDDSGNASQVLSIVKSNNGLTMNCDCNTLSAGNTTAIFGYLYSAHVCATGNLYIGSNQETDIYYNGSKLVITQQLVNPTTDNHETRITALENGSTGGSTKTWVGTQSQYDEITIKDGDTFYYITEN